ncbi:MAG: alpha-glucuronidase [candidate division KSB1 bacterium]|nr:alpha-glucuronidase [candidate division KSB1 bacterium]MDZ7304204.1 alpha-glucuronidase [candidate division KSB1 bacterium]MDZ7313426.1 alpha-glucuronidase [candidate division KSB1 bacterium]
MLLTACSSQAEDGYRLWLRYDPITNVEKLGAYRSTLTAINLEGDSPIIEAAREELCNGLSGLLGTRLPFVKKLTQPGALVVGTPQHSKTIAVLGLQDKLRDTGEEGFLILTTKIHGKKSTVIAANNDIGILYGVFHFLRLLQTQKDITSLAIISAPKIKLRLLNHWDNLNRTVERGYAGFSLWDWHKLPDYISPRYKDYARANASIGINGTVLTNVNANALVLTGMYLEKVAALAEVFRPYGIKVYLTARFSAPVEIGGLTTADPLNPQVRMWWQQKAAEIYRYIPDFGGFLVKANSEGQPGPQNYGRSHADGANMLAEALAPHGGVVMWRAFVYDNKVPEDRAKQAYNEFKPLDGKFRENVLIQVKNGPIDFQPREPFHPLFGAMPNTPLMMEFQITQEYLGFATHLVYLAPLFKEVLDADTYAQGAGSYVAKVIDGTLDNHALSGMAGVSNIGTDRNWCGHPFAQANWFAFGRLAWDHAQTPEDIADDWLRMTFTNDEKFITPVKSMMRSSREITVSYMTPLGLHHLMGWNHHYGPAPWINQGRPDWTSVYYHRADSAGIGFDRSATGSNAVSQYFPPVQQKFGDLSTCPESYLLWFHHVPWVYKMKSGRTLWEELCYKYYCGVDSVRAMRKTWESLAGLVDDERFCQVQALLKIQEKEAIWWRNACLLYFQTFSQMPIPPGYEKTDKPLEYYMQLKFPYAPGI